MMNTKKMNWKLEKTFKTENKQYPFKADYYRADNGMEHIHLQAEFEGGAPSWHEFGAVWGFDSLIDSNQGCAHILEHMVLCGSKHYPGKDPFFNMLKRSVNSFMNAMTGADYTVYPFATPNRKDFHNLFGVYTDAVFNPLLESMDFDQEAWRLERDKEGEWTAQGVVLNEMKGHSANSSRQLYFQLLEKLNGNSALAYNFGGDPRDIKTIDLQKLRAFHQEHYQASKSKLLTVGAIDLEVLREQIEKFVPESNAMNQAQQQAWSEHKEKARNTWQAKWPECMELQVNAKQEQGNTIVTIKGQEFNPKDALEEMKVDFLNDLLFGEGSLLEAKLLESPVGLAGNFVGLMTQGNSVWMMLSLQEVKEEQEGQAVAALKAMWEAVLSEGVNAQRVEALLVRLEQDLRASGDKNVLINPLINLMSGWVKGVDPEKAVAYEQLLQQLRAWVSQPENVKAWLQGFKKESVVATRANENWAQGEVEQEKQWVIDTLRGLTPEQLNHYEAFGEKRAQREKEKEALVDCLPVLGLEEIEAVVVESPQRKSLTVQAVNSGVKFESLSTESLLSWQEQKSGQPNVIWQKGGDLGMVHGHVLFDLSNCSEEELGWAEVISHVSGQLPLNGWTLEQTQQAWLEAGSWHIGMGVWQQEGQDQPVCPMLKISFKCAQEKLGSMLALIESLLTRGDWNQSGLKQEWSVYCGQFETKKESLVEAFARLESALMVDPSQLSLLENWQSGPLMLQRAYALRDGWDVKKLSDSAQTLSKQPRAMMINCANEPNIEMVKTYCQGNAWEHKLFNGPTGQWCAEVEKKIQAIGQNAFWESKKEVNTNGMWVRLGRLSLQEECYASLLAQMWSQKWLLPLLREKGGAYGASASYVKSRKALMAKTSQDPRVKATQEDLKKSFQEVCDGAFEAVDVEQAKRALLSNLIKPMSEKEWLQKSANRFWCGQDDWKEQERKVGWIKEVSIETLRAFAKRLEQSEKVLFGSVQKKQEHEVKDPLAVLK